MFKKGDLVLNGWRHIGSDEKRVVLGKVLAPGGEHIFDVEILVCPHAQKLVGTTAIWNEKGPERTIELASINSGLLKGVNMSAFDFAKIAKALR